MNFCLGEIVDKKGRIYNAHLVMLRDNSDLFGLKNSQFEWNTEKIHFF